MTNVHPSIKDREPITAEEFEEILQAAQDIKDEFFRLRALAVVSLLRLTGKRREEIAKIPRNNFRVENELLSVTFELEKKKRRFKICPPCHERNSKTASFCKNCGECLQHVEAKRTSKPAKSTKSIPLSDPLTQHVLNYLEYLDKNFYGVKYWLPRGRAVFGNYSLSAHEHLTGRSVFNIVKRLSPFIWPHLFRETVGSDVIKQDPTIIGAFRVQQRLDLEGMQTGLHYLRRYATDVITRQLRKEK